MALVHRDRPLPDWSGFVMPERWRKLFDAELEQDGWLRIEEYREGDTIVLRAEMAGIDPDKDVEITVDDHVMHIRAHRQEHEEHKGAKGYRSEFRYGEFARSVRLPEGVSGADIKATYEDGILQVVIPVPPQKAPEVKTVPITRL